MITPAQFRLTPCDPRLADALRRELGCTETLAWVLARRGVTPDEARALLDDDPARASELLHDPMLLGDMAAGVERIRFAIAHGERIVVHGDYDADGVCATTLLVEGLEELGATVDAFLPDRFTNGYGLQIDQVERLARAGARLLIAVDCGITAVEAVAHANDLGLDVIICDHHRPGPELPAAIICSTQPSSYPFPELCATAVAGKLLVALGGPSGPRQHELEAIATVADCMPLVEENRVLVQRGLRALRTTSRPGLRALAEQCGVRTGDIDAEVIAFKLAPRINAVGRISQSERAYELLRAAPDDAARLAAAVDATNEERRSIERAISEAAIEQVEGWSAEQRAARIYVVHGAGWHEGVVGIVASRLVERYFRPVIVVADGDPARGSGRSIPGVDLHAAIAACDELLLRWGGHAQAGGITIDPARIDELAARLASWADEHVDERLLVPCDDLDAIVPGSELHMSLVQELERLAPFGTGWPRPRLLATGATMQRMQAIGSDGSHLRGVLQVGESQVPAIAFGMAVAMPELADDRVVDVALRPSINRFRGTESLQVQVDRFYPVDETSPCDHIELWCAAGCSHDDAHRVPFELLLDAASGLVTPELATTDPDQPPAIEAVLARAGTLDLRHRSLGVEHVAQLLAAGARVLAVVADVPRRRDLFASIAHGPRLGVHAAMLASEHHAPLALRAALQRHARGAQHGPALIVSDYPALEHVLDSEVAIDVVAVVDPPATTSGRDRIAALADRTAVHLLYGAAQARFTAAAARHGIDVRSTLADAYRHLRDHGPADAATLERLVYWPDDAAAPRSPAAIVHGMWSLLQRGIIERDGNGGLRLGDAAASQVAPTA